MSLGKILVVDDDRSLVEVLKVRIESAGYEVTTALKEETAINTAKSQEFDLAIVDLQLESTDGITLMQKLRPILPGMAVIILTAHGTIESAVEAMRQGAFSYLTKPFSAKELLFQIEKALESRELKNEIQRLKKLAEERMYHMATHDGLTDLPNLRLAMDRLSMALSEARRRKTMAAVMFIDLDGFKAVNDTLGHDAGDRVLKQVARRLLSCVRETDTVSRVGGDEFLVVATGLHTPENAAPMAEKILQLVSQPFISNGQQPVISASIGIAFYPDHGEDRDQLIKLADEAMYQIKKSGKNGYSFANTVKPLQLPSAALQSTCVAVSNNYSPGS